MALNNWTKWANYQIIHIMLNLILEIRWLLALHIRDNNSVRCYEIYPAGYTVYQTPDNTSV